MLMSVCDADGDGNLDFGEFVVHYGRVMGNTKQKKRKKKKRRPSDFDAEFGGSHKLRPHDWHFLASVTRHKNRSRHWPRATAQPLPRWWRSRLEEQFNSLRKRDPKDLSSWSWCVSQAKPELRGRVRGQLLFSSYFSRLSPY